MISSTFPSGNKIVSAHFVYRSVCPVCGSSGHSSLVKRPLDSSPLKDRILASYQGYVEMSDIEGASYEVRKCNTCGLIFQFSVPGPDLRKKIYTYDPERAEKSLHKKKDAALSYFSSNARSAEKVSILLNRPPHQIRVLEFGSGWGYWSRMAQAYGYDVTSMEISDDRKEFSSTQGGKLVTSFGEIEGKEFDFIYADQVLEHIDTPKVSLSHLLRALAPHGIIFVGVPNGKRTAETLSKNPGATLKEIHPLEHINCFTNTSLIALAQICGLVPLPPLTMAKRYLSQVSLRSNLNYIQEALKAFPAQRKSTGVYFVKSKK